MRVAYFTNHYPAISHTFIKREIRALERTGFYVTRIALRGWEGDLVDEVDVGERGQTTYLLRKGYLPLIFCAAIVAIKSPRRFTSALIVAVKMGLLGARPLRNHLGYLIEACAVAKIVKDRQIEHVHAHFGTNSAEIVMLTQILGGPTYSFTVHGPDEFDEAWQLGIPEKVRRSRFTVAITSFTRGQLLRWVDYSLWEKIKVIRCGVDAIYLNTPPTPVPDVNRLVYVGRLSEQKGLPVLVEAVAELSKEFKDFQLVAIGDGPLRDSLKSMIRELKLESHIVMKGSLGPDSIKKELLNSRGLVMSSFAEGLPMVIMESMALRRPVLATNVAGIAELVRERETGFLVSSGSADDLLAGMRRLLETSVDQLSSMGEQGYISVLERHNSDKLAAELGAEFESGLSSRTFESDA